jgi:hypothetical protein
MTDNGNQSRPVRTLTVKNFSVIKEAKLEFGKITVLIGPQSSGKSLLCKLAYFLGQIVPEAVNGLLLLRMSTKELQEVTASEFQERFPVEAWGQKDSEITYTSSGLRVTLRTRIDSKQCMVEFDPEFVEKYEGWVELHGAEGSAKETIRALKTGAVGVAGPFRFDESVYIPTGRAFFSTPNRGFASVSNKNLDWITQRFSNEIDWDYRAMLEPTGPSSDLLPQFVEDTRGILGGRITRENGALLFRSTRDGSELPFQWLSSGTQEMLPLMNPLSNLLYNFSANPARVWENFSPHIGPIYVEEPELSVFPGTQYELVKLFAWLAGEERLEFPFVITTHSPYILTAFNNLIEAGQVTRARPEVKDEVASLIPERYWIKDGDFKAYAIEDGRLKSILNESGFIEGNYLDQVSEVIGNEFDALLRLEYDHTKAS